MLSISAFVLPVPISPMPARVSLCMHADVLSHNSSRLFRIFPGTNLNHQPTNQVGRAQGKGIFLFKKLSEINDWKKVCLRDNFGGERVMAVCGWHGEGVTL